MYLSFAVQPLQAVPAVPAVAVAVALPRLVRPPLAFVFPLQFQRLHVDITQPQ
jgi:hypothetical protein